MAISHINVTVLRRSIRARSAFFIRYAQVGTAYCMHNGATLRPQSASSIIGTWPCPRRTRPGDPAAVCLVRATSAPPGADPAYCAATRGQQNFTQGTSFSAQQRALWTVHLQHATRRTERLPAGQHIYMLKQAPGTSCSVISVCSVCVRVCYGSPTSYWHKHGHVVACMQPKILGTEQCT